MRKTSSHRGSRLARLGWVVTVAVLIAATPADPVPQSPVRLVLGDLSIPDDPAILERIAEAVDFRVREDHDIFLDAWEPGELLGHAQLTSVHLAREHYPVEALFVAGDELFEYAFRPEDGLGNGLQDFALAGTAPRPNMRRVHHGNFGGPDAFSCSSCHSKGGPDGAGTQTQSAFFRSDGDATHGADQRNPPHLLGLGPVQALAVEMSETLQSQAGQATELAASSNQATTVELSAKGVPFGALTVHPDGTHDTSNITGVDADLVIKPFGWKGHQATIRGIAEESFRIHLGLVSTRTQAQVRDGLLDPTSLGNGPWSDLDADGVSAELDEGMLTTITAYLALLEVPIIRPPQTPRLLAAFAHGQALFDEVGCAGCHIPTLELTRPVLPLTRPDSPAPRSVDIARVGESPRPEPKDGQNSAFLIHLFSDLKRHDMGSELATPTGQSQIGARWFLTRPLWGLADTAPYLHDGRAPTVDAAIRMHGGEARESATAYEALSSQDQAAIQVYLLSLTRAPRVAVP